MDVRLSKRNGLMRSSNLVRITLTSAVTCHNHLLPYDMHHKPASVSYSASNERHMNEHCLQTPSYRKPRNCTLTHERSGTWRSWQRTFQKSTQSWPKTYKTSWIMGSGLIVSWPVLCALIGCIPASQRTDVLEASCDQQDYEHCDGYCMHNISVNMSVLQKM